MILLYTLTSFLLFYLRGRTIFGGDSAEYSMVANTWGISHPPGYPLYSLILNLARIIFPFLSESLRTTGLSIIFTLIVSYLLYKTLLLITKSNSISVFSSFLYIFLYPIWLYSEVPEVFPLNNLFIIMLTYLVLKLHKTGDKKILKWIFLFLGLSFSHHYSFLFFLPGWIYLIYTSKLTKKLEIKKNILFFFSGLSFYFYPIIVSALGTQMDPENASTLDGFLRMVTRSSYGAFQAYTGAKADIFNQLINLSSVFIFILQDFRPLGSIIIFIGFLLLWKKNRQMFSFFFINTLSYLFFLYLVNFNLSQTFPLAIYERFLIAFYLWLIFPLTYGIIYIKELLEKIELKKFGNRLNKNLLIYFFYIVLLFLFTNIFLTNFKTISSLRKTAVFAKLPEDLLMSLPKNSILALKGDTIFFSTDYFQTVKKVRTDILNLKPGFFGRSNYIKFIHANYPDIKITLNEDYDEFIKNNTSKRYFFSESPSGQFGHWSPYGLVWKYYPDNKAQSADQKNNIAYNNKFWSDKNIIPVLTKEEKNILQIKFIQDLYINKLYGYSLFLYNLGKEKEAVGFLEKILQFDRSHLEANMILMKRSLDKSKCTEANRYFSNIANKYLSTNPLFVDTAIEYYNKCSPKNFDIKFYEEIKSALLKNKSVPLNNIK